MTTYGEFQPTGFDCKGLGLPDQQHWLVLQAGQTRDSSALDQSNFATALSMLGGESDTVQVHRFGHWGPSWFELILVDPVDVERVKLAEDIEDSLEDYPVLSEDDLSAREDAEYQYAWQHSLPADFAAILGKQFSLSDTAEYRLWDADVPLQALYEELTPSGDWWEENGMCARMRSAAGRCTRERIAGFLREHRHLTVRDTPEVK